MKNFKLLAIQENSLRMLMDDVRSGKIISTRQCRKNSYRGTH